MTRVFFSFIIMSQLRRPIELKFLQFFFVCICWDTPTMKASLWHLPIVSTVFHSGHCLNFMFLEFVSWFLKVVKIEQICWLDHFTLWSIWSMLRITLRLRCRQEGYVIATRRRVTLSQLVYFYLHGVGIHSHCFNFNFLVVLVQSFLPPYGAPWWCTR